MANKLRVSSDMKMTKVNLDLYVPRKKYAKIISSSNEWFIQNERCRGRNGTAVRTANGKIEVSH